MSASLCALLLLAANGSSEPATPADRLQWLRTLVVPAGETVSSAVCVGCSIVIHGRVTGDAIAFLGGIEIDGESGHGAGDDVIALGGGVALKSQARVPASLLAIGGPVWIEPGADASQDVDALQWLHVPGQRRFGSGSALTLLAFAVTTALAGAALLRQPGIARHDDALCTRPLTCALTGGAVLTTAVCLVANGRALGRFELVVVALACLALAASVLLGFTGVASAAGRAVARGLGRREAPGWRSLALGAPVVAGLCLLPLAGAAIAFAAVVLASGAAFVRPSR